jgi:hypothetical protein
MQANSANYPKRASGPTTAARSGGRASRKRDPIDAAMLAGMVGALINECLAAGLPVKIGPTTRGGLLVAFDALTIGPDGIVIARPQVGQGGGNVQA